VTYPNERQIEYWTSRAIEDYFDNEQYTVVVVPNSQRTEHQVPFDHLFVGPGVKVFGLQYERLYPQQDHWRLDAWQHRQMQRFVWIYYALSAIKHIQEHRNALHLLQLTESDFAFRPQLHPWDLGSQSEKIPYARWGGFVQMLFGCHFGWQPGRPEEVKEALEAARELADALIDLYFVAPRARVVVRVSPFVTDVGGEEPFDLGLDWQEE
jgi:hypothetical protein